MDFKIQTWLLDINQAIDEIFLFIGEKRDFNLFKNDLKTKKSVASNLKQPI